MPVAVHIAAVPAHATSGAVGAGARGKASSAESKAGSSAAASVSGGASVRNFAVLFREKAGVVEPAVAEAAPTDGKKGTEAEPGTDMSKLEPKLEAQVSTVGEANPAAVKASVQLGKAVEGVSGPSESKSAITTNLPKALLAGELKSDLSGSAQSGTEIVAAHASAVTVSESSPEGKEVTESSSAKGEVKTKEEASSEKGKRETANAAASAPLPVIAVAAAPVVVPPIAPMKAGITTTKNDPKSPLNTALKTIPPQGTPASVQAIPDTAEDHNASASAPSAASGAVVQEPNLKGAGAQPVVADSAANGGIAGAKALEDTVKASATPAASAQCSSPIRAAISEMIAPAAAAVPAMVHGSEAPNPAPHIAQQVPAAASATVPVMSAAPVAVGNAYDKMDQGVAPVVLHSGAQHVSVGVQDPNLGWVEIKTQNLGGHVDATLVTASGQSHDLLAAQLPAMAQFLEQRDVRVGMLAVHHEMSGGQGGFAGNGSGSGSGNGSGSGANYGNGTGYSGHAGSDSGHSSGGESRSAYAGLSSRLARSATMPGVGVSEDTVLRPVSYISVRA